jgi:hypothetical protein
MTRRSMRLFISFWILGKLLLSSVQAQEASLQIYDNAAFFGKPIKQMPFRNFTTLGDSSPISIPRMVSARILGTLDLSSFVHDSVYVECHSKMPMLLWLDDHIVCQSGFYNNTGNGNIYYSMDGTKETPILIYPLRTTWTLYGEFWPVDEDFSLVIRLMSVKEEQSLETMVTPGMPPLEMKRLEFTQNLIQRGSWGTYNHDTLQELVWLPGGIRLRWTVCHETENRCVERIEPAGVQLHSPTTDQLMHFDLTFDSAISIKVMYKFEQDLEILFQTLSCGDNDCSLYSIRATASIAYSPARSGTVTQPDPTSLTVHPTGLRPFTFSVIGGAQDSSWNSEVSNEIRVRLSDPNHIIAISTRDQTERNKYSALKTTNHMLTEFQDNATFRMSQYLEQFGKVDGHLADAAMAVDAALYYNLIYTPVETAFIAPVSRAQGWTEALCMPYLRPEFGYIMFDWDNALVAYLMAMMGKKEIAYASIIQSVRSRTARGFTPNNSAGGHKTQDRSEPPLGAKILEEIYNKYRETWLVELLWSDLAIQVDWYWNWRRLDGFIVLGSDPVSYSEKFETHTMQAARYESGLDNSPMYDGDFFEDGLMRLYDVGITSLVLQECDSLARLARIVGKDGSGFEKRAQSLRAALLRLWDSEDGIFSNLFPNGKFSKQHSPTSFYPLLGHAASDAQAESMVQHWLMNSTRFCIGHRTNDCWWGLPSISADDPAFAKLGYWRGYVWGPMAMITYWGLENYKHLPVVASAKKQLASQMTEMFLNMWHLKGRVCENYSPHRNATDCTGDPFYHWGALNGLLSILESEENDDINHEKMQ